MRKVFWMIVGIVVALFVGFGTAYVASEDVRYLTRAGLEETRILELRRPLRKVAADTTLAPGIRGALHLVIEVRDAAADLGLDAGKTYTTYADVGRDTLLLVLSASPKNCLCPRTWKYPIVGRVPYKGFFDPDMGGKAAAGLEREGYDVYLRIASAFSTLGWFNDPLLSTAISTDSVEMAALVFHEMAHNTLYVKSATPFNETFAQMVGYRAAEAFFRARGDTTLARRAADRWHDELVLSSFYDALGARLEALYSSQPDSLDLEAGRMDAGTWMRDQLTGPVAAELRTYEIGPMAARPVNNARLIAARIYRTRSALFEAWYWRWDGNVGTGIRALDSLLAGAEGDRAFERLEAALVPVAR
jgi:predicted aminopeptidase